VLGCEGRPVNKAGMMVADDNGPKDSVARRSPGRPAILRQIEALIVKMAIENRDWG